MMRAAAPAVLMLLAACSPQEVADKVTRRAAETVVLPVVSNYLPGPQARTATYCVLDNATAGEIQGLARDIAVEAGSDTVRTVLAVATRPETLSCLAAAGIPALKG